MIYILKSFITIDEIFLHFFRITVDKMSNDIYTKTKKYMSYILKSLIITADKIFNDTYTKERIFIKLQIMRYRP